MDKQKTRLGRQRDAQWAQDVRALLASLQKRAPVGPGQFPPLFATSGAGPASSGPRRAFRVQEFCPQRRAVSPPSPLPWRQLRRSPRPSI